MFGTIITNRPAYGNNAYVYTFDDAAYEQFQTGVTRIRAGGISPQNPFDKVIAERMQIAYGSRTAATFSYTGQAERSYIDDDGVMQFEASNPIFETVEGRKALRLEPQGENLLLDSRNMDNGSTYFIESGTGSADQTAIGVDGGANKATVATDNDGAVHYYLMWYNSANKGTTDQSPFCFSVYVLKTTGATTFPGFGIYFQGGTQKYCLYAINTNTGEVTAYSGNNAGNRNAGVIDTGGDWWRVWVTGTDSGSNPKARVAIYPHANNDASDTWVGTLSGGSVTYDCAQLEYNKKFPSSYIDNDLVTLGSDQVVDGGMAGTTLDSDVVVDGAFANTTLGDELVTDGSFEAVSVAAAKGVAGITKANPGVVTFDAGHGYADGDIIYFSGLTEMTELNTEYWQLQNNAGDTFELAVTYGGASLDTSGYGAAETTGGNCAQKTDFTNWVEGIGWCVGVDGAGALTNKAVKLAGVGSQVVYEDAICTTGKRYKVVFTVSGRTAGSIRAYINGGVGDLVSTNTTHTQYVTALSTDTFAGVQAFHSTFDGNIDDVTIKEVTADDWNEADYATHTGSAESITVTGNHPAVTIKQEYMDWSKPCWEDKVDAAGRMVVTDGNTITITALDRDEDCYKLRDMGAADYFDTTSDFTHYVDIYRGAYTVSGGIGIWALTSVNDDLKDIVDAGAGNHAIFLFLSGKYLSFYEIDDGVLSTPSNISAALSLNTTYYLTIRCVGGSPGVLHCDIYSDAARETLVETISETLTMNHTHDHIGVASYNAGSGGSSINCLIENLSIYEKPTAGKRYKIVHTSVISAGSYHVEYGSADGATVSASATTTDYITATDNDVLKLVFSSDFDGTVDDVSIEEITLDDWNTYYGNAVPTGSAESVTVGGQSDTVTLAQDSMDFTKPCWETKVDAAGRMVITDANTLTVTDLDRDEDCYMFRQLGSAIATTSDFTHYIDVACTTATSTPGIFPLILTKSNDDIYDIKDAGGADDDAVGIWHTGTKIYAYELNSGAPQAGTAVNATLSTPYYLTLFLDASQGTYGRLYVYVFDAATRTADDYIGTSYVDLTANYTFQFIGVASYNDGNSGRAWSGTIENLSIYEKPVANYVYQVAYTITRSAGSMAVELGSATGATRSASGTYYDYLVATDNDYLKIVFGATFAGTIDDVSIKKMGQARLSEEDSFTWTAPSGIFGEVAGSKGTVALWFAFGFDETDASDDSAVLSCDDRVGSVFYHDESSTEWETYDSTIGHAVNYAAAFTKNTWMKAVIKCDLANTIYNMGIDEGSGFNWATAYESYDGYNVGSGKIHLGYQLEGPLYVAGLLIFDDYLTNEEAEALDYEEYFGY